MLFYRNTGAQSPLAVKSMGGLRKDDGGKESVSSIAHFTKLLLILNAVGAVGTLEI